VGDCSDGDFYELARECFELVAIVLEGSRLMKVRTVEESAHRYLRNSMRAYLEGKNGFRWVTAIIGNEPEHAARAMRAFNEITRQWIRNGALNS